MRAHLRCVAEQPPLKLDTSSEVQPALAVPCLSPSVPQGSSPSSATISQCCGAAAIPSRLQRHQGVRDGDGDEDEDGDRSGGDPALLSPSVPQKLEFLQLFGLTTQQQKEELLSQKRRKRRRMLRERSPSPPTVQNKRRTPSPRLPLSTRYSPDEMNNSPNFEEKKRFLTIFNLTHISAEKRKGKTAMPRARSGPALAQGVPAP